MTYQGVISVGKKPFIVITSKNEVLTVGYEMKTGQRMAWTCPDLDVYVVGPIPGKMYEQAANLAMQEAISRRIAPSSLKSTNVSRRKSSSDTKSRRMF